MITETAETLKQQAVKTDLLAKSLGSALDSLNKGASLAKTSIPKLKGMNEEESFSPDAVMERQEKDARGPKAFVFPAGLRSEGSPEFGPYMQITAFKYKRGFRELGEVEENSNTERYYSIRLPLPPTISQEYSAHFGEFPGSAAFEAGAGLAGTLGGGDLTSAVAGSLTGIAANSIQGLARRFIMGSSATVQNLTDASAGIRNQASAQSGISINPRYEISFDSMTLRSHTFEFNLVPTSKEEAEDIDEFEHKLRRSMHPDQSDMDIIGFAYFYPDEFIITFHDHNGDKLSGVPSIPDVVLVDMQFVKTTGRLHSDSSPVATRLTLQFKEMKALTRKKIDELRG